MNIDQLTRIFCQADDFCKEFNSYTSCLCLPSALPPRFHRGPKCSLSESEIMTLLILFQSSGWRNFKHFYLHFLGVYFKDAFPHLPSYHRFIEIMNRVLIPLSLFAQLYGGKATGLYYIDSTCLPVCHLKRSKRHKSFESLASYGRTSVGWFFGLKLHLVINQRGELMAFKLTRAHQNDAKAGESLLESLKGLAFGDKGYISQALFERLLEKGLKLITRVRKNMKPAHYSGLEKQLLNRRGIIETVIHHLKHHYQIWHTRHRSVVNAMTHLVAGMAAYAMEPLKLSAFKLLAAS